MRLPRGRTRAVLAMTGAAIALAGCGTASMQPAGHNPKPGGAAAPPGWHTVALTSGGALPYPPGWRQIAGDPGTGSAALLNRDGTIRAYLNATPADRQETLARWAPFRLHHNAEDGDRNVRLLASQVNILIDTGRGSCVTDQYVTSRSTYRELACVVAPAHARGRTVLVAAAQPSAWTHERHVLEYAIRHFAA